MGQDTAAAAAGGGVTEDRRTQLLALVKKSVKQLMEESVTRKFVHEDSPSITALCAAVDGCLSHGLRRRALGLFKTSSTTALLYKICKQCESAAVTAQRVHELERGGGAGVMGGGSSGGGLAWSTNTSRLSNSSDTVARASVAAARGSGAASHTTRHVWLRQALFARQLTGIVGWLAQHSGQFYERTALLSDPESAALLAALLVGPCALEYSRLKTCDHFWSDPPADELVQRARISTVPYSAPVGATSGQGRRLCHTQRRPLSIDPAGSGGGAASGATHAPGHQSPMASYGNGAAAGPIAGAAVRDYVESLHQNNRTTLLYGKNNVLVQTNNGTASSGAAAAAGGSGANSTSHRQHQSAQPGYLSLHQLPSRLVLKWTPNQLMNGGRRSESSEAGPTTNNTGSSISFNSSSSSSSSSSTTTTSALWDDALHVPIDQIVYLHCHQPRQYQQQQQRRREGEAEQDSDSGIGAETAEAAGGGGDEAATVAENGGTVVLVGQDGVQQPPLIFPPGGHLLAFLSCLETGLLPHGQLDPPLWAQRGRAAAIAASGGVFPQLRRRARAGITAESRSNSASTEPTDYVFRIVYTRKPAGINSQELMYPTAGSTSSTQARAAGPFSWISGRAKLSSSTISTSSTSSGKSFSLSDTDAVANNDVFERSLSLTAGATATDSPAAGATAPSSPSIQQVCASMTRQIISRAFYGWLAHCRHLRTVRTHLNGLVHATNAVSIERPTMATAGVTSQLWHQWTAEAEAARSHRHAQTEQNNSDADDSAVDPGTVVDLDEIMRQVYFGGVEPQLRPVVWPYLLQHHELGVSRQEQCERDAQLRRHYEALVSEWMAVEAIVTQRDKDTAAAAAYTRSMTNLSNGAAGVSGGIGTLNEESEPNTDSECRRMNSTESDSTGNDTDKLSSTQSTKTIEEQNFALATNTNRTSMASPDKACKRCEDISSAEKQQSVSEADHPSADDNKPDRNGDKTEQKCDETHISDRPDSVPATIPIRKQSSYPDDVDEKHEPTDSCCNSPASSNGGIYSAELLDAFSLNIHRIDKDVQRCDRHHQFFSKGENLITLRNILCSYVWERLEVGYMQGMCDLVAPLLVTLRDECLTYSCFCRLMDRMSANFPQGGAMDQHFANMRSLIRVLDAEMFEHMQQNGDYTHFYFCYRWFLLDFKRELVYDDVFRVWETIWAGNQLCSPHFVLFIALALVQTYRDIIIDNHMDFTDIIKFFNEMAERHNADQTLGRARDLVSQLQALLQSK